MQFRIVEIERNLIMFALQQLKGGKRIGKIWVFSTRELAQESVKKTYITQEPSDLMQTSISISPNFVQVSTNYMGTIYFAINEVIASDTALILE